MIMVFQISHNRAAKQFEAKSRIFQNLSRTLHQCVVPLLEPGILSTQIWQLYPKHLSQSFSSSNYV